MSPALVACAAAFLVAVALVPPLAIVARRNGAVAMPRSDRFNPRPVPVLGGLAIAGGVVAGALALAPAADLVPVLAGMAVMATLGLADDLRYVPPILRVLIEAVTAAAMTWLVTPMLEPPIRVAAIALATVCIPVAVNAVNLVDNADGLASLLSIVTALTLAAIGIAVAVPSVAVGLSLVIAAASLGFLVHNRPPARVFMGDSGSLLLGFGLAACSVLVVRDALLLPGSVHAAAAIAVPLAWAVQIGDLGMVFVTRLRRRASPFRGGVDHTSHRLIAAGVGPTGMLIVLSLLAASLGAAAVWLAATVGDFRLVAAAVIALTLGVAAFEAVVAWRLPYGGRGLEPSAATGGNAPTLDPVADPPPAGRRGSAASRRTS
ncbi:MAG TPA: MraY family glycosyltransferase [Candidatus Limnocylindrales bacterium]|nr:MraY family glycosyltransferase [Candidatus Limnocylindrales bacterium]